MAGDQLNNVQLLDANGYHRSIEASDNLQIGATVEFQSDVSIAGSLTATNVVSITSEELRVADNHIFLNDGYTTAVAQTAGLVANYLPIATTDTVAATGFTAGVPATSNPTVNTTGSATFAVGQFILITSANEEANNGLYEVLTHTGTTLTIRGVGTTGTVEDFTEDQFTTDTTVAGSITRVTLSILRAGTDGIWETASGSTTGLSFTDTTAGSTTLQQAYDNDADGGDATITTNATDGAVVIAGTEELRISATGGLNVDTQADFDVTVFDVLMSSGGFSIDGAALSNVSVTGGNLQLDTITSGDVDINSAAGVLVDGVTFSIDSTDTSNLTMTANNAAARNLTVSATNAGAGTGNLLLVADDEIDLATVLVDVNATGAVQIDAAAASNFTVASAGLTLATTTSGDVTISTTTAGDVIVSSAAAFTADSVTLSIDSTDTSNLTMTANNAAARNLTVSATNAGAGTGNLLLTAGDEIDLATVLVDINATGSVTVDAAAASNFTVAGAALTLSTTTSGNVVVSSAADIDADAANVLIDATAGVSIDAATDSNLTLSGSSAGTLTLTVAAINAGAGAGNLDINVDDTLTADATSFSLDGSAASNVTVTGGNVTLSTLTSGNVVLSSAGDIDADAANILLDATVAISLDAASASNFTVAGANLTLETTTSGSVIATSAGLMDLNAGANLDIDVTGTVDILASTTISIDGTGASNFSATSGNLTLSTITSGSLLLTSAGDSTYTVPNASATAFDLTDGSVTYMRVDSVSDALDLPQFNNITGEGIGIELTTDSALVQGNLVQIVATTGNVDLADANTGNLTDALCVGVSTGTFSGATTAEIVTAPGSLVPVLFSAAPAAAANGDQVFLSSTAGQGTLTAPSGASVVVFVLGILQGANGADTTPNVLWQPRLVSVGPTVTP
jgi:hypothetical protein